MARIRPPSTPKKLSSVLSALDPLQEIEPVQVTENPMLIARCRRLAGRSKVIGRTVFKFNENGFCLVKDVGRARYDFDVLLKQNGVEAAGPQKPPTAANPLKPTPTAQRSAVTLTTITEKYEEANKPQPIVRPKRKPAVAPPAVVKATPTLQRIPAGNATTGAVKAEDVKSEASDNFLGKPIEASIASVAVDLPAPLVDAETVLASTSEVVNRETGEVVIDSDEDTNPEVPTAKKKASRRKSTKAKSSDKKEDKPKRRRVTKRKKKSDN